MRTFFSTIVIAAVLMLITGCGKRYTITVSSDSGKNEDQKAYLVDVFNGDAIDSADFKDGKAVFKGSVDTPYVCALVVGKSQSVLVVEQGDINYNLASGEIEGGTLTPKLRAYVEATQKYNEYLQSDLLPTMIEAQRNNDTLKMVSIMNQVQREGAEMNWRFFEENKDNAVGAFLLVAMNAQGQDDMQSFKQVDSVVTLGGDVLRTNPSVRKLLQRLQIVEASREGKPLVDFEGIDYATGKVAKLSDFTAGKIVVVDFWASWCGPCRKEITETLIPLYNKYKDKGVLVIGVDMGDRAENHDKAVKELGIEYPQFIDNDNCASELYGISSIPHIMVLDAYGTIVRRGVRGTEIEEVVSVLLNAGDDKE